MDRLPNLHVIAGSRTGLSSVLNVALAQFTHLRFWRAAPPPDEVQSSDLIVVDLSDPPRWAEPNALGVLVNKGATLCLVLGDALVPPSWVELARRPEVRVLRCGIGHGRLGYGAIVMEVLERVRGPAGERIAALVLETEPELRAVESLVQAVCLEPWRIRRPRDLAKACAMSLAELKRHCVRIGFARVEHFMICVRLLAYERLVATAHLPASTARLLAGFTDPANMRRRTRRAARRSPPVAHALESLHVVPRAIHVAQMA
jgi:AraC-like DNA-binding protein